ncbi:MAG: hypothetical protein VB122_05085 [Erysipelotrichales bacterium]|nr:hypothetical protein [Erysipelotrichales bacterium]
MKEIFNDGFTNKSFLNLCKLTTEAIYAKGIAAESNKNKEYNTKGLDFYFINDNSINACVCIEDNLDKMYVNTGTITNIYSLFYSAFSNCYMFQEIGDAKKETQKNVDAYFDFNSKQILLTGQPKDNSRRIIAEYVSQLAIRYICAHELGHLFNGHAYLLKQLYGTPKVEMIPKYDLSKISDNKIMEYALDRRTLEMDADAFAASASIVNLIGIYKEQVNFKYILDLLESPLQIFELWAFAVHNVFMLFELSISSEYSKESFYLPNLAREALNISAADTTLREQIKRGYFSCTKNEYDNILKCFASGIQKAEKFFKSYNKTNFDFFSFASNLDKNYVEFTKEVNNHWDKSLKNRLKKYSRAILYDPNGMDY